MMCAGMCSRCPPEGIMPGSRAAQTSALPGSGEASMT